MLGREGPVDDSKQRGPSRDPDHSLSAFNAAPAQAGSPAPPTPSSRPAGSAVPIPPAKLPGGVAEPSQAPLDAGSGIDELLRQVDQAFTLSLPEHSPAVAATTAAYPDGGGDGRREESRPGAGAYSSWTVAEVGAWLAKEGMTALVGLFEDNQVTAVESSSDPPPAPLGI